MGNLKKPIHAIWVDKTSCKGELEYTALKPTASLTKDMFRLAQTKGKW